MSAVHDRWELVEPLLFAQTLRDPRAFRNGAATRSQADDLEALVHEHRFEESAIARALKELRTEARSPSDSEESLHSHIRAVSSGWLATQGDHWGLRIDRQCPGHEIIRWRGVTMLVPPSIAIAGALSGTERSHPCSVQVLPNSIAPRGPVGHLHVHLGPMLAFEGLWDELWSVFLQRGTLDTHKGDGISSIPREQVPEIGQYAGRQQPGRLWQWIMELGFAARVWLSIENAEPPPAVLEAFGRGRVDVDRRRGALLSFRLKREWRQNALQAMRERARSRIQNDREAERTRAAAERVIRRSKATEARTPEARSGGSNAPTYTDDEVVFVPRPCDVVRAKKTRLTRASSTSIYASRSPSTGGSSSTRGLRVYGISSTS